MAKITFRNDSVIEVVTAADTARGGRASLLIIDEYRMVDKEVLDLVLKKFLNYIRHPGYMDNPWVRPFGGTQPADVPKLCMV